MSIERTVIAFAGTVILLTLALGWNQSPIFHSANWLWLTAFVGANLLQSSFTGFCPLATVLKRLGKTTGPAFK